MTHDTPELWLICVTQHLYGPDVLDQVRTNADQSSPHDLHA